MSGAEFSLVLLAYLLGSIPFGVIIGKLVQNINLQAEGSGNIGGTNAYRVLGRKWGILTTILDIGKGALAVSLPFLTHVSVNPIFPAFFVILGHIYPVFLKFKGGKAVATTAGVVLILSPLILAIGLLVFAGVLILTKMVSLSSLCASVSLFLGAIVLNNHTDFIIFLGVVNLLIFYRHRENLVRIKNGTESKFKK